MGVSGRPRIEPSVFAMWRPLSIAPSMAERPLLKFAAYASLFFFVSLYPFGFARATDGKTPISSRDDGRAGKWSASSRS